MRYSTSSVTISDSDIFGDADITGSHCDYLTASTWDIPGEALVPPSAPSGSQQAPRRSRRRDRLLRVQNKQNPHIFAQLPTEVSHQNQDQPMNYDSGPPSQNWNVRRTSAVLELPFAGTLTSRNSDVLTGTSVDGQKDNIVQSIAAFSSTYDSNPDTSGRSPKRCQEPQQVSSPLTAAPNSAPFALRNTVTDDQEKVLDSPHREGCAAEDSDTGFQVDTKHLEKLLFSNPHSGSKSHSRPGSESQIFSDGCERNRSSKRNTQYAQDAKAGNSNTGASCNLTPAQQFFLENRDLLMQRAQRYFTAKKEHFDELPHEKNSVPHFDTFYFDPVVRPPRGHVWDFGSARHEIPREEVRLEQGRMPTMKQLLQILEQEHVADVTVIDLESCGRRDLGLFFIIATGQTGAHCERTGKLMARLIRKLEVPHISEVTYCWGSSSDCWVISHLGPLQLHILTQEMRERFRLESALMTPHDHFTPDAFPGYFDGSSTSPPPFVMEHLKTMENADAADNTVSQYPAGLIETA